MKSNKLLFILHLPPPIHGPSVVGEIISKSKIINNTFESRYINLGISKSVDEIGKNALGKISRYIKIILAIFKQLQSFKPSLVYLAINSKGLGFYKDSFVALIVKLSGFNSVYHFHNKGVSLRQDKLLDNLLYKLVFKGSKVILLSDYLYLDIQKYVPKENIYICPNGITDLPVNKNIKVKHLEIIEILFLSNLIESKGVFVLLDACKLLQDKDLKFHCTFVGGVGNITEMLFQKAVIERDLGVSVYYTGKKYANEKKKAFQNADIFVHPTYEDCFPLVIMEAMQHSLPVVSTFEGGIADIVENGKTGFLVPQKDANALAEKLEMLIKDADLRQKMGNAGRLKYEKQFTLEHFENRLK